MGFSPYNLRSANNSSTEFYGNLQKLADLTYDHVMRALSDELYEFAARRAMAGEQRTIREYIMELLTLAMAWREYLGGSQRTPTPAVSVLKGLYALRSTFPHGKIPVDCLRGILSGLYIYPVAKKAPRDSSLSLKNLHRLIEWLRCTGEFHDEVTRFSLWYDYFCCSKGSAPLAALGTAVDQLSLFIRNAEEYIGEYTLHVTSFRENRPFTERWREDALFRDKSRVEYHLNMLASEIINQGFCEKYLSTSQRVVLVPACMRERDDGECKRVVQGLEITCGACSESCAIYQINTICIESGHRLNIVPHSSTFTKWLKRWENSKDVGLVAVACPLNITVGGYQMRELNIPSQCVMLDYCGCSRHWGPQRTPTAVNTDRLIAVLEHGVD
jgi:hypothetical protein